MSEPSPGNDVHQSSDHPVYRELKDSDEFIELRRRYQVFVIPATAAFLGWYLLYVAMSIWATGFMSTKVVGNINIALIFGLLQFVSTFLIAWQYARYMNARVDPLARELEQRYVAALENGKAS